ncbi:uncharacterized protein LOC132787482 isoform X3 [Drosophila nasuta]|uniref:uncharacterized protein LOC132787482 isoform X3 n=1 Tax=Drosophila nasuta TaxID=42062 RepID=UPI00295EDA62|nr:uncharacterized protein LOC132787482 isoform X3 [Drosophila nasuta]
MASAQMRHFYNTPTTTTTNKSTSITTRQLLQQQQQLQQQQHTANNSKRKQFESETFLCHTTTKTTTKAEGAATGATQSKLEATWQPLTPATLEPATTAAAAAAATARATASASDDAQASSGCEKGASNWLWTIHEIAAGSNSNSSSAKMLQQQQQQEQQELHQQYPVASSHGANCNDDSDVIGTCVAGWQHIAVVTVAATVALGHAKQVVHDSNRSECTTTTATSNCKPAIQSRLSSKTKYGQGQDTATATATTRTTATATTTSTTTGTTTTASKQRKIYQHCTNNVAATALGSRTVKIFMDMQKFARTVFPLVIVFNLLPLFYAGTFQQASQKQCDQTFVSRIGGPQNGSFTAPLLHNHRNHSRQCLYTFLAGPGQRVEVVFKSFNLRGSPPDGSAVGELPSCVHEYMDIYSEVQSSEPAELINSPFGGRYCGAIPPRRRISMYRAVAISFFSNKNVSTDLFEGTFRFINASEYEIGIPIAGSPCSYTITPSMSINKTGALISPTYPGAYPKDMSCTYQFLGESNQRVRLEFRDFDLFFGGPHCPFDYVKVYDGPDNSSALIGTYCGQQRNLVLYSSESSLFVHFYTLPRTANTQNRGFKGIYEFSESFVKLDFIRENDGIHIRGSECDQKILSKKESTGFVLSPNYPYPYIPKTVCRYFIYGMQDAQHLERVRLEFNSFNIPKMEHKDKSESNCTDGYLKIYLKGQETADAYDKFDYELCGNETQRVISDGPRLAMVFSSGELQGRGFKGKYTFETEYKIPGTAAPDGTCSFTYVSSSKKRGELNSPRYPSNYPSDTNCSYLFLAEHNEQVTIVFDHFKIKADNNANATAGAYGSGACFEDWLEMYVVYRDNNDRLLGRYCGLTAPGPVESPRGAVGLRITLHTDQESVASGFKARYFFESAKSDAGDCGGNFSNEDSGIITSPNYPAGYKAPGRGMASNACNWVMTARAGYKLSINFEQFALEGDPAGRGCPAAVLRLWVNVDSDQPPVELCGEKPPVEQWHYISTGQTARISFTTSDKTVGAQGFRIVWTEIQDSGPGPPSIGLLCESTYHFQCAAGYCISDKLRCDGVKNCGPGDDSDELHCITEAAEEDHDVLIIITLVVVLSLICLLCTLCHSRRKRRNHVRQLGLHRNAHYDSQTSATAGLSSSRRHLQSGGASIAGSLHGINSGTLIIPPAPLPPTSVPPPPHICIAGVDMVHGLMSNDEDDDDDDDDLELDEEDQLAADIFINDVHFDEDNIDHVNQMANV